MIPWADIYYKAGATAKGDSVVNLTAQRYEDDLNYFASLSSDYDDYYKDQIH